MIRLLYENSVSYGGHLIVPFIFGTADNQPIYSYKLLSDLGHKGRFHKAENPGKIYSSSIPSIVDIAKEFLERNFECPSGIDRFQCRYTYRDNLIIVYEQQGKFFYDHYKPDSLNNIAAPKLFISEESCINWIKQGLDRAATCQPTGK